MAARLLLKQMLCSTTGGLHATILQGPDATNQASTYVPQTEALLQVI